MNRSMRLVVLMLFVSVPSFAHAQVVISEFLYDAPGSDTDQEWIEIFNAGSSSVDLSKWKVNDGSNHVFNVPPKNGGTGSLTLASGAYLILAGDATTFLAAQSSLACSVIDTTLSLGNTSGAISLVDDSGATVDTISYTKDLGAVGDGNTLHRNNVTSATVSAVAPSPCAGNMDAHASNDGEASVPTPTPTSTSSGSASSQSTGSSSSNAPPQTLFTYAGEDKTVIVGADVRFVARAYTRTQDVVTANVTYAWNFGDGGSAEGGTVAHHWEYPGRYVVVLTAHQEGRTARHQIIVTAEAAKLSFAILPDGGVEIGNHAGRDLDLSSWIVKTATHVLVLPENTVILSGEKLRIGYGVLRIHGNEHTELHYPNGMLALSAGQTSLGVTMSPIIASSTKTLALTPTPLAVPVSQKKAVHTATATVARDTIVASSEEVAADDENLLNTSDSSTSSTKQTAHTASSAHPVNSLWSWGAAALALAGGAVAFIAGRQKKGEWEIEEA